jgi:hypothetical protein
MFSGFISAGTQLMLHNPSAFMALCLIVDSSWIILLSGIHGVVHLCICIYYESLPVWGTVSTWISNLRKSISHAELLQMQLISWESPPAVLTNTVPFKNTGTVQQVTWKTTLITTYYSSRHPYYIFRILCLVIKRGMLI